MASGAPCSHEQLQIRNARCHSAQVAPHRARLLALVAFEAVGEGAALRVSLQMLQHLHLVATIMVDLRSG